MTSQVRKLFRNKDCAECFLQQNSPEKAFYSLSIFNKFVIITLQEYEKRKKWDSQHCYNPYFQVKELSNGAMINPNSTDLVQKDDFDSIVMGIIKNFEQNSLPDSISILINFGTEKSHVLYDADQVFPSYYTSQ